MGTDFDQLALLLAFGAERLANDERLAASVGLRPPQQQQPQQNNTLNNNTNNNNRSECDSSEDNEDDDSSERNSTKYSNLSCCLPLKHVRGESSSRGSFKKVPKGVLEENKQIVTNAQ